MKTKMFFGVRDNYVGPANSPTVRGEYTCDVTVVIEGDYIVEMDQNGKPTFVPIEYLQQPRIAIDHRGVFVQQQKPIPLTISSPADFARLKK
jgi:hypothetical protein